MGLFLKIAGILKMITGVVIVILFSVIGSTVLSLLFSSGESILGGNYFIFDKTALFIISFLVGLIIGGSLITSGVNLYITGSIYDMVRNIKNANKDIE